MIICSRTPGRCVEHIISGFPSQNHHSIAISGGYNLGICILTKLPRRSLCLLKFENIPKWLSKNNNLREKNDSKELGCFSQEGIILKPTANNNYPPLTFWINTYVVMVLVCYKADSHFIFMLTKKSYFSTHKNSFYKDPQKLRRT